MVFVFGVDVPLVELIFVLTLIMILLFGMLVYLIVSQVRLTRVLNAILDKEGLELKGLKVIRKENQDEIKLLRTVRSDLDKMAYAKALSAKEQAKKKPARKKKKPARAAKKAVKPKKTKKKAKPLKTRAKVPLKSGTVVAKNLVVVQGTAKPPEEKPKKVYEAY
jgi:hypothetical protein